MRSFENGYLEKYAVSNNLLKSVRMIGEYRGKESLYRAQSPQLLETLKKSAIIQSVESSNRIEGVVVNDKKRLKALMENKTEPTDRSEQEIAGYRDVLNAIHGSYSDIPLSTGVVLQFHRDLLKYTNDPGGRWKSTDNTIEEKSADGTRFVRFKPISAWQTAEVMEGLHSSFKQSIEAPIAIEPLLAIPAYMLDFLCIHPFLDGNGRMSRLLSLLLLYKSGYTVGSYISLERIVEDTKEAYYDALFRSSQKWHSGKHDLTPWLEYFLGVMLLTAYKEFEKRVGLVETAKGAKAAMILAVIEKLPPRFTISDVISRCPTVGIDHVRKILRQERDAGHIRSEGLGPRATWIKCRG